MGRLGLYFQPKQCAGLVNIPLSGGLRQALLDLVLRGN